MERPFPAYEGDQPYVFVSYAHGDAGEVYPEISWLHQRGFHLWYDEGISPGAEFPEALAQAIDGAALVLYYVSAASVASRHCRDEVYFALERKIPVLALHLEETELPAGIALSLGTSQAILRHKLKPGDYRQRLLDGMDRLTTPSKSGEAVLEATVTGRQRRSPRRAGVALLVVASIAALAFGAWSLIGFLDRQEKIRWVRYEAIPEIKRMLELEWSDLAEPYALTVQAEAILPDDPEVVDLLARTSLNIDIETEPAGAEVYVKRYSEPEAPWQYLGTTPLKGERLAVGFFRWRLEKPGFAPLEAMHSTWNLGFNGPLIIPNNLSRKLERESDAPEGMVRVGGGPTPFGDVPDFHIDRFEVTNRQYKAFMDAGGYDNPDWWRHPFEDQSVLLDRETAMAEFVDQSGRPGPATWLGGTYPDGAANHPVSGVSWFEAAAYAAFVGRTLPSSVHWGLARGDNSTFVQYPQLGGLGVLAPFGNFNRSGTVPVGSMQGLTTWGTYDMAGNVAEWCSSETDVGRVIRGGSFDDNTYEFAEASNAPPMMRTPGFGFRTALIGDDVPQEVLSKIVVVRTNRATPEPPVSEEVFQAYLQQFEYDRDPLNAVIEDSDTTSEQWTLERVAIDTAYDAERMRVHLFLPTGVEPPYQTVIYFPGSGSVFTASSERLEEYYEFPVFLSFLVNSGRAVVYPVYKGTFERSEERLVSLHYGSQSHEYSEYMIKLVKDFRRSVDYLESRADIDADNLAYYGMSWGGLMGSIIPAVEPRVKTSMLLAAGMPAGRGVANPVHYAPRIETPTLMMVGRYDTILGYEASAKPLFDALGTDPEDKKLMIYETDHIPEKRAFVTEMLTWLDRYLGPVD